jgi:hypothetical protein
VSFVIFKVKKTMRGALSGLSRWHDAANFPAAKFLPEALYPNSYLCPVLQKSTALPAGGVF